MSSSRKAKVCRAGNRVAAVLPLLLLSFATESEARAYTDPGTGALIWQALAAGAIGLIFYFRRFTSWVRPKKQDAEKNEPPIDGNR